MRPPLSLAAVIAAALAMSGCERHTTVASDLGNAAHSIGHAAAGFTHDPNIRQAQADLRQASHDAGHDFHRAESEARDAAKLIAAEAHRALHNLTHRDAPDRAAD
jgi:hypothetical protein